VIAAGRASPAAQTALAELCELYWIPVFSYIRRSGRTHEDAEDLTQAFFARVIEKSDFKSVRPELGRFRTFLLTAVRNFLANRYDHDQAKKRGGGIIHIRAGGVPDADGLEGFEPGDDLTTEDEFEHRWALSVLKSALSRLQRDYATQDKARLLEVVLPFLTSSATSYQQAATTLNMDEGAVRVAVHRLRRRFGVCLRSTLAETVSRPEDIDPELRYLLEVINRRPRSSLEQAE
jgi:RNA polymerase sigma-70 factor (ECF subfamily)